MKLMPIAIDISICDLSLITFKMASQKQHVAIIMDGHARLLTIH